MLIESMTCIFPPIYLFPILTAISSTSFLSLHPPPACVPVCLRLYSVRHSSSPSTQPYLISHLHCPIFMCLMSHSSSSFHPRWSCQRHPLIIKRWRTLSIRPFSLLPTRSHSPCILPTTPQPLTPTPCLAAKMTGYSAFFYYTFPMRTYISLLYVRHGVCSCHFHFHSGTIP